jgi:phosphatidylglycerol:prolipoprotein diacylglycerol transferase
MLPVLQVGPLALPVPELSMLLAFWFGLLFAERFASRHAISTASLYNLTFTGLITGLISARIGYVLQYPGAFIQSPLSLFSLNRGLFDPFSALAGALIGMLVYGQRDRLPLWNALDALTPTLAIIAVGLAVMHIASGNAFGSITGLPWGIELWGAKRHPTQFYELITALGILAVVVWKEKSNLTAGTLFLVFTGLQAGARLYLEAFRGDSSLVWIGLRTAQITAWVTLGAVFFGIEWIKIHHNQQQKE